MRIYVLGLLLVLTGTYSMAQQQKFTLKQCIDYSLQNHLSNQVYQNSTEIANQQGREAIAGYLPQVNLNTTFDDNIKRQTSVFPASPLTNNEIAYIKLGQP